MKKYLAQLNPTERRFVVGVAIAVFVVLNLWVVFPHFSDWSNLRVRLNAQRLKLANYQATIAQKPRLERELRGLEGQGQSVPPEDQAGQFFRTIQLEAGRSGVFFMGNSSRSITTTNAFFMEQAQTITVQGTESQLVNFLYNLGAGNSLIRVRAISIHPDPSRTRLYANVTLVASYQKGVKPAAGTPPRRGPIARTTVPRKP